MKKELTHLEQDFISDFIKLRKDNNLTQQKLSDLSGVIRETIARIEAGITSPQINTLIKILKPLGYTVKIEKIEK
ncbi:MAG: helix-turn-helix transcriptional regulator [Bacilli bacterium]|nr:helix-turn-helix transcriptional regulator [Bacilli bacterium]